MNLTRAEFDAVIGDPPVSTVDLDRVVRVSRHRQRITSGLGLGAVAAITMSVAVVAALLVPGGPGRRQQWADPAGPPPAASPGMAALYAACYRVAPDGTLRYDEVPLERAWVVALLESGIERSVQGAVARAVPTAEVGTVTGMWTHPACPAVTTPTLRAPLVLGRDAAVVDVQLRVLDGTAAERAERVVELRTQAGQGSPRPTWCGRSGPCCPTAERR